jgi:methylthioribose-1-phosphate isomerase
MYRLKTIEWSGNCVRIINQTKLPMLLEYQDISTIEEMYEAIKQLRVRGAPAIGIAAAFGLYLGIRDIPDNSGNDTFASILTQKAAYLASARPTAVNLFWALGRLKAYAAKELTTATGLSRIKDLILNEAQRILQEDRETGKAIGKFGFELFKNYSNLLTHCNAGGLATAEYGTALAPIYIGKEEGKLFNVYADETRPLLQGARITAFELHEAGIPVTLICDNMAATVMAQGKIDAVIVGADRIAANGDTVNKIGTYGVALLAKAHNIPFYVAAPFSTFDLSHTNGAGIPIEERGAEEVVSGFGAQTAPSGIKVYNPAFDMTPHPLITAIITERGVLYPPFNTAIAAIAK